ncbi:uncharacterized protein LOC135179271 [Pogoniulus pusillus]|uniref:uncharacterized protein LOC135179271 n=1 Tax=Pogoniulus pusillus TaxID=488313 RepID=UPI0030B979F6
MRMRGAVPRAPRCRPSVTTMRYQGARWLVQPLSLLSPGTKPPRPSHLGRGGGSWRAKRATVTPVSPALCCHPAAGAWPRSPHSCPAVMPKPRLPVVSEFLWRVCLLTAGCPGMEGKKPQTIPSGRLPVRWRQAGSAQPLGVTRLLPEDAAACTCLRLMGIVSAKPYFPCEWGQKSRAFAGQVDKTYCQEKGGQPSHWNYRRQREKEKKMPRQNLSSSPDSTNLRMP